MEDTEKARRIYKDTTVSYKEYADEYKKLKEWQFNYYSVQYKEGMFLDPGPNMAIPDQKDDDSNIINDKNLIASHHYFVSIDAFNRTDNNFWETFFELNMKSFMDGYLANIENLIWKTEETLLIKIKNNTILDRIAKHVKGIWMN